MVPRFGHGAAATLAGVAAMARRAAPTMRALAVQAFADEAAVAAEAAMRRLMPWLFAAIDGGRLDERPYPPPDEAAMAWLGAQIGVDFAAHPARACGVAVGRILPDAVPDGIRRRTFSWAPPARGIDERVGTRAILIPTVGDVVAIDAADARAAWSLSGNLDPLGWGEPAIEDELAREAPAIGICEDALTWLARLAMDEAGGIRAVMRHGEGEADVAPAIAVLDWGSPFVDRLLRRDAVTLIAESDGHAEQVERAIDAWRKRQVPRHRPEILVADAVAEPA